jgi:hypothetical protein
VVHTLPRSFGHNNQLESSWQRCFWDMYGILPVDYKAHRTADSGDARVADLESKGDQLCVAPQATVKQLTYRCP